MKQTMNMQLFDRFRQVNRKMRRDLSHGSIQSSLDEGSSKNCKRNPVFQREMILCILKKEGNMKQQDLADELHIGKSTLSQMISRLVADGYVKRTSDPKDRRAALLVLTQMGHQRALEITENRLQVIADTFKQLSDSEKAELIVLLDKMLGDSNE